MKIVQITEGISSVLYHATMLPNLLKILETNQFRLTPDIGTQSERSIRKKNKIYYLSTARSRLGSHHTSGLDYSKTQTLLVLDGNKLAQDGFSGKPVDYWGPEFRKVGDKNEMEDRIFSPKPYIDNAQKYIKEIHIYHNVPDKERYAAKYSKILRKIAVYAKKYNIPLYVYNDPQAFKLLDKRRAISPTEISPLPDKAPLPDTDVEKGTRREFRFKSKNPFSDWIELIVKNDIDSLSPSARKKLWYIHSDGLRSLAADIHNYRTDDNKRKYLDSFLSRLKNIGVHDLEEFGKWLDNKWNKDKN